MEFVLAGSCELARRMQGHCSSSDWSLWYLHSEKKHERIRISAAINPHSTCLALWRDWWKEIIHLVVHHWIITACTYDFTWMPQILQVINCTHHLHKRTSPLWSSITKEHISIIFNGFLKVTIDSVLHLSCSYPCHGSLQAPIPHRAQATSASLPLWFCSCCVSRI